MAEVLEKNINESVLENAMHLFWQHGYAQLSIDHIVKATGLNRAAIYNHFGDKQGLYQAVLQYYLQTITPQLLQPLYSSCQQPMAAIKDFFCQFMTTLNDHSVKNHGCLVVASAIQSSCVNDQLDHLIQQFFEDVKKNITKLLEKAQQQGLCSASCHCQQTASFLVGNLVGILTAFQMHINTHWVYEQIMMINQYLDQLMQK